MRTFHVKLFSNHVWLGPSTESAPAVRGPCGQRKPLACGQRPSWAWPSAAAPLSAELQRRSFEAIFMYWGNHHTANSRQRRRRQCDHNKVGRPTNDLTADRDAVGAGFTRKLWARRSAREPHAPVAAVVSSSCQRRLNLSSWLTEYSRNFGLAASPVCTWGMGSHSGTLPVRSRPRLHFPDWHRWVQASRASACPETVCPGYGPCGRRWAVS
jgi:hypothetical protein